MFSIARYFYKNPPTSTNLFKLPDNLSIDNSIEPIQREWKKQLEKESPSFFWALFNAYKSYTIITIFCMGIVLNCYAFSSILIKFLLDYLEDDNAEDWEGALIVGLYILNFLTAAITIEYAV